VVVRDQLYATGMGRTQDGNRRPGIEELDITWRERNGDVYRARKKILRRP
jgi:hypothetical protein